MDIHSFFAPCSSALYHVTTLTQKALILNLLLQKKAVSGFDFSSFSIICKDGTRWESDFHWLVYDEDLQSAFCKHCQKKKKKKGGEVKS